MTVPFKIKPYLRDCPFCGSAAESFYTGDSSWPYDAACTNSECPMSDCVVAITVEEWNRRGAPIEGDVRCQDAQAMEITITGRLNGKRSVLVFFTPTKFKVEIDNRLSVRADEDSHRITITAEDNTMRDLLRAVVRDGKA